MAALLQIVNNLKAKDAIKDEYWTLVGYFNSIRELGKCATLVADDIKDAMRRLRNRLNNKQRIIYNHEELTGRIQSNKITRTLEKLQTKYSEKNIDNKEYAANVLLATNMISVGVDVSRLNLMVIVGQPKLTSEYIQASSRVGRSKPGIVFTLYNGARSRDKSYYEKFVEYHQSFYKYVEPTSITPFSEPSRDRCLHAMFISLMRHIGELNNEENAIDFDTENEITKYIERYIINRVQEIDDSLIDGVREDIKNIEEEWLEKIKRLANGKRLLFSNSKEEHLLKKFGDKDDKGLFETLQAMRNVDAESAVHILSSRGEKDE